jgi:hypothetical protein
MTQSRLARKKWKHPLAAFRLCAVLLAPGLRPTPTLAAESAPVPPSSQAVVVLPPWCGADSLSFDAFLDDLRVELAGRRPWCCALGNADDWPPATASIRVELQVDSCAANANHVRAVVSDPAHDRDLGREISLADVAEAARPRALALAVAELIRSLGQGVAVTAPPLATKAEVAKPPSSQASVRQSTMGATSLYADFGVCGFPSRDTALWGGRLGFTAGWRAWHVDLDAGGGFARTHVDLGEVRVGAATASLTVGPRFKTGMVRIDLGLRGELGWAWVDGVAGSTSVRAGAGSDLISSAGLRLSLLAPRDWWAGARIGLEGGSVIHGVSGEANGQAAAGIAGFYWLASVGLALERSTLTRLVNDPRWP